MSGRALIAAAALALAACAHALREPPVVDEMGTDILAAGGPRASPQDVDRLLAEGDESFERRPDPEAALAAQRAYLEAARADPGRVEGLIGLVRVSTWRIEHARDDVERKALVPIAVQSAQWCGRRDPEEPRCDYWLAVALGLQARERPGTAHDGLNKMVEALRRAIARAPDLDDASPHRVLALVLLRAPGWPLGPGDAEAGLVEAREAAALFPGHPPNQIALAEALARNGRADESRAAYARAHELAAARARRGDPDAEEWEAEAARALTKP